MRWHKVNITWWISVSRLCDHQTKSNSNRAIYALRYWARSINKFSQQHYQYIQNICTKLWTTWRNERPVIFSHEKMFSSQKQDKLIPFKNVFRVIKDTLFLRWKIGCKTSIRQHPSKPQLYGHLPPITKTIKGRRTRHSGHCWRSRDELISDVLLSTPSYDRAKAGRPVRTYIQQFCEGTGCSSEDLPEAMNDREEWRERLRDIRADGMTWWYIYIYIYIYICVCVCVCVCVYR